MRAQRWWRQYTCGNNTMLSGVAATVVRKTFGRNVIRQTVVGRGEKGLPWNVSLRSYVVCGRWREFTSSCACFWTDRHVFATVKPLTRPPLSAVAQKSDSVRRRRRAIVLHSRNSSPTDQLRYEAIERTREKTSSNRFNVRRDRVFYF
jgi:hypothetical protein